MVRFLAPRILAVALCLIFLAPLILLCWKGFFSGEEPLVLQAGPMVVGFGLNTIGVTSIAVGTALLIGGTSAWAVSAWDFRGRRVLSVLLCLPFAIPPYLLAGLYRQCDRTDILPLPPLNNIPAVGIFLGLALYPWVYLPLKAHLTDRSQHYREVGETLGLSPFQRFWKIHLPLMLPTLGVTALLVTMEGIGDFGTASLLGVKTLSVGIHDTMFAMRREDWAAQLSLYGLLPPLLGIGLFALWYRGRRLYSPPNRNQSMPPIRPGPVGQVLLVTGLLLPLTLGFLFPVGVMLFWAFDFAGRFPLHELPSQIWDTLYVTLWVAGLTTAIALLANLAFRLRRQPPAWNATTILINLYYALPGVMLGIAILFLAEGLPDALTGILLSESVVLLVFAGVLAYLCFPFFSIKAGLEKLSPRIDDLAALFDFGPVEKTVRIYLPLIRQATACGLLLVAVNMAKELPLVQVLQPFGHQALSQRLYTFAGLDLLEESAVYSLCLVLLVIYPVVTLDRLISGSENASC